MNINYSFCNKIHINLNIIYYKIHFKTTNSMNKKLILRGGSMEYYYHIREQHGFGAIIKEFDKEEFKKWIIKCENYSYYDSDDVSDCYIEGVIVFIISDDENYEVPFYFAQTINEDDGVYTLITQIDSFELFSNN